MSKPKHSRSKTIQYIRGKDGKIKQIHHDFFPTTTAKFANTLAHKRGVLFINHHGGKVYAYKARQRANVKKNLNIN